MNQPIESVTNSSLGLIELKNQRSKHCTGPKLLYVAGNGQTNPPARRGDRPQQTQKHKFSKPDSEMQPFSEGTKIYY